MNERFKIKLSHIGELMDCDTQSILAVSSIANELIPLCDLLNNLHDENEQLKKYFDIPIDSNGKSMSIKELLENYEQLKQDKDDLIDFIKKEHPITYKFILEGFE